MTFADALPCPFCGSEPVVVIENWPMMIYCEDEDCLVQPTINYDDFFMGVNIVNAWNERPVK